MLYLWHKQRRQIVKIAIISDIHSNYQALKSAIEDCEKKGVEKIFCCGDIIGKGCNANKCVNLIRQKCEVVVRGNTDTRFTDDPEKFKDNLVEYNRIKNNHSLLNEENFTFIKNLPFSYEFYLSGNLVRIFHATPTSEFGFINDYDTNMIKKYAIFLGSDLTPTQNIADIVIFGHLHYSSMLRFYNKIMINCGSVGASACPLYDERLNSSEKEITQAHYLIIEGKYNSKERNNVSFSFESVCYDIEKELEDNNETNNTDLEDYKKELRLGKYRNIDRIKNVYIENGYIFE